MNNLVIDAGVVALIVGVVEAIKSYGLPSKYSPIASLVLGIAYSLAFVAPGTTIPQAVVEGIAIGLAASGLYSGGKALMRKDPPPPDFELEASGTNEL